MTPSAGSDANAPLAVAYILAGGRSRRFGRDKARFAVNGRPLLLHACDFVAPYASRTVVVAQAPGQYDDLAVATIGDRVENRGPLGGLHTALGDAPHPCWFALVACDWFGARSEWLQGLLDARGDSHAVAYRGARFEAGLALFHTSIGPLVDRRLADNVLDMQSLFANANTTALPLPTDWNVAINVNRMGDLRGNA